jgi:hypothetical protein
VNAFSGRLKIRQTSVYLCETQTISSDWQHTLWGRRRGESTGKEVTFPQTLLFLEKKRIIKKWPASSSCWNKRLPLSWVVGDGAGGWVGGSLDEPRARLDGAPDSRPCNQTTPSPPQPPLLFHLLLSFLSLRLSFPLLPCLLVEIHVR